MTARRSSGPAADQTGSWDGRIRIWALDPSFRSFKLVSTLSCAGFINGLQMMSVQAAKVDLKSFASSGEAQTDGASSLTVANGAAEADSVDPEMEGEAAVGQSKKRSNGQTVVLAAAVSQEPRLGRWMRIKDGVQNGLFVAALPL